MNRKNINSVVLTQDTHIWNSYSDVSIHSSEKKLMEVEFANNENPIQNRGLKGSIHPT